MKKPNIFISHQWGHNYEYYKLKEKMDQLGWAHSDYSVPHHDSFDLTKQKQIEAALKEQVRQCNFFIVIARMASGNSNWIDKEVQYALEYGKFILGVKPWGYKGNIPLLIQDCCDDIVGFNVPSIINIIEDHLNQ